MTLYSIKTTTWYYPSLISLVQFLSLSYIYSSCLVPYIYIFMILRIPYNHKKNNLCVFCVYEQEKEGDRKGDKQRETEKHSINSPESWSHYLSSIMLSWMQNSPFPLYSYKKTFDKRWGNSTASITVITPDLHFLKKRWKSH